jgi:hypothetical protein
MFQTVTPHLLGSGTITDFVVPEPFMVWAPSITRSRLNKKADAISDAEVKINQAVQKHVISLCESVDALRELLLDQSDIIPMLPLGIYVRFTFNVRADDILKFIEGINAILVYGINEVQGSFAASLKYVLEDFSFFDKRSKLVIKSK